MSNNAKWWKISPARGGKDWDDWLQGKYCLLYNWEEKPYYSKIKKDLKKNYKNPDEFLKEPDFKGEKWPLQLKTFVWDVNEGDIAFAYKQGEFVGVGKVESYYYNETKGHLRNIDWKEIKLNLDKTEIIKILNIAAAGTIKNIDIYRNELMKLIKENNLNLTYLLMENSTFDETIDLLSQKSQIILYGPPGTGKTYKAREFAVNFIKNHIKED
ncbi:MAG: hypothetical protein FIB08_07000 [Candidatus Methanoperedens sp.]|nr:hypothetical protein [Candidatus Methanoperedens sp.]